MGFASATIFVNASFADAGQLDSTAMILAMATIFFPQSQTSETVTSLILLPLLLVPCNKKFSDH